MSADLSANAAKANALKTYDAGKAAPVGSGAPVAGTYAGGAAAQTQGQAAPAPTVVYNNYGNGYGGGGGSSGPGFWSGLFVGNLLSGHRSSPNYEMGNGGNNANSQYGRSEGQGQGRAMQPNEAGASSSSSSWFGWTVFILAIGGSIAALVWFIRRKKKTPRYQL